VLASGSVASVDPLLAAGPALALLAGALVAVRLIPPASKVLEAVAARGRKAVLPLAAWEVGRRSARAISAILLLTLAVSIGTFAVTFLNTWHQSQDDQALYQHPPDAIVKDIDAATLAQRPLVDDGTFAKVVSPVVSQSASIGAAPDPGRRQEEFNGWPVSLVATDDAGLKTYGVGRLNESGGARIAETLAGKQAEEINPVELPSGAQQLSMKLVATTSQEIGDLQISVRAVVREQTFANEVLEYLVDLVRSTRGHPELRLGASPRSTVALYRASQAWAFLDGRAFVLPEDVRAVAPAVLGHRLIVDIDRRLRGTSPDEIVANLIRTVPVPLADAS
jgi:hypothetical protein